MVICFGEKDVMLEAAHGAIYPDPLYHVIGKHLEGGRKPPLRPFGKTDNNRDFKELIPVSKERWS